tara:strand:+ start:706 stop:945 length:240 start_codon:yes stop_codon:yes gene_type:complete
MRPRHCYDDKDSQVYNDLSWIESQIDQLPISIQKKVAEKYSDIYLKLTTDEERGARFRANSWLRKTVDKYKVTNQEGLF